MGIDIKKLAAFIAAIAGIVTALYGAYSWLDDTIVTQKESRLGSLQLLIALDRNRITTYEMHETTLNASQKAELSGLRITVTKNECEYQKIIGLLEPAHNC